MKEMRKRRKTMDIGDVNQSETKEVMKGDGVDLFSQLPDNVINAIFEFLPMKDAIHTCILSKKLSQLLMSIPNLEFRDLLLRATTDEKRNEFVAIVNKLLENRDGAIRSFRLRFSPGRYISYVVCWVIILMQCGVRELDLDFLSDGHGDYEYELPSCLFSYETLTVLKLRSCIFRPPSSFSGFSSLVTLFLGNMSLSQDLICCLLSKCGLLQSFTLQRCYGFEKIDISDLNKQLESLTLEHCPSDVMISVRKLRTLHFCNEIMTCFLDRPAMVENAIIFRGGHRIPRNQVEANSLDKLLNNLFDVRSLSLLGWSAKCLAVGEVSKYARCGLLKLELEVSLSTRQELNLISYFLDNCPNLEELIVWINVAVADENPLFRYLHHEGRWAPDFSPTDDYWKLAEEDFGFLNNNLQWITINNFTGWDCEMEFVIFLAKNTERLRTITINPMWELDPNQHLEFINRFSMVQKGRRDAKILLNQVQPNP
ncbi:F-box/FBD/LRR-repeat protein At1g13570-like [Tasmannia lanceolata]|uniref:F-box/FBD/LRR-repeat protein At1g13570-like n=1 Tax=Tasmannia lanceolata TaxID=3420 RepID=UPI00406335EA